MASFAAGRLPRNTNGHFQEEVVRKRYEKMTKKRKGKCSEILVDVKASIQNAPLYAEGKKEREIGPVIQQIAKKSC